ncbi:DUF4846 domain-containing protein [Parasegetibacter sp. NRK P23]|uniref:DUF4846 domain-containing protein n=1 Tax=Parasegetibacter sp. NRK P23 TaxID=2942999 RepID=UPI002043928D|nr:DUF4846 domain-containing protein [Parasegetibacter sp. NRK P23]MCM5528713.1 DUF4846 domain-containing protein [Parasegetibacter sp. NRK P23]
MKQLCILAGLLSLYGHACTFQPDALSSEEEIPAQATPSDTLLLRFPPPAGYELVPAARNTFVHFLHHFPMKPHGSAVYLYDGRLKANQQVHAGVLDIDVGKRDLQQCADAVMRLRAEYLFQTKQPQLISFNFVNGFSATYSRWANGERIQFNGNHCSWKAGAAADHSYINFRKYLDIVFAYASTISLSKQLHRKPIAQLEAGDVFIEAGSPGHAVIVMAVAREKTFGKKIFLLAQSYMPAQDIHILVNKENRKLSPWYEVPEDGILQTPEWRFNTANNIYGF